jgi:hypothetical protein
MLMEIWVSKVSYKCVRLLTYYLLQKFCAFFSAGGVALTSEGAKRTVFRSGDDLEDDFVMEDGGGVSHTSEQIDEGEILDGSIDLANTLDHMENLKSNLKHKITTSKKNVVTPKIVTFKS